MAKEKQREVGGAVRQISDKAVIEVFCFHKNLLKQSKLVKTTAEIPQLEKTIGADGIVFHDGSLHPSAGSDSRLGVSP